MPDPTPDPKAPAPSGGTPNAPAANAPAPLTADQVKGIVQELVNPIFAEVRRLKDSTPPPPAKSDAEKSIAERIRAVEETQAKANARLRLGAIRDAAREGGVLADRMRPFEAWLEAEHGARIRLEGDNGVHLDEFERPTPLKDYVSGILKTGVGEMFRAPVKTPQVPAGGRPAQAAPADGRTYMDLTQDERLELEKPEHREKKLSYLRASRSA